MFRNFYSDGCLSEGQSAASSSPLGVAFDGQENSWIGLLSRPALSLLRKFRLWSGGPAEVRNSLIGEEREFLRQLNEMMPLTPPAAAQHLGAPAAGGSVSWLELQQEPPLGYFPPVRTLIHQVLVNSQEAAEAKRWVSRSGKAGLWWGGFLRGEELLCPPRAESCPVLLSSVLPENARPPQLEDSGVQNTREEAVTDHGYSSLEEEISQRGLLSRQEPADPQMEEIPEEPEEVPLPPRCQNKNIAFIMGCPCSDDDDDDSSSQSEPESSDDDDDDDGFDSEGSSDLSDSSSSDEDDSERLWTSLCQNLDPYNPRNFTAQLHSSSSSAPLSSSSSSSSSSPPPGQDSWDDSTSASEADEAESLRLLSSFSRSSDPYSPLDFKAPLRTRGPAGPPPKTQQNAASPPRYRKEEAEERLDSGFSETSASTKVSKKVRFCDDVEEFFASCGSEEEEEDRRGPWEELARDRCRFLRRCLEVERSIEFCLQPQHRQRVYQRLSAGIGPSGGEEKIN